MTGELRYGYDKGKYYQISENADEVLTSTGLNQENFQDIFASAMKDSETYVELERLSIIHKTPIHFDGTITETNDGNYKLTGKLERYLYVKRDFDSQHEFEIYAKGEADDKHNIDLTFSAQDLQDKLNEYGQLGSPLGDGVHKYESSATVVYGLFMLVEDSIK